ncbi:hypothetical protein RND81_13G096700 [Saponaria officinalis]|uniref:Uncharacterized protein n=1 Tax=Saponaria officinalis TaxID=3572 RepID=A0AAW1GYM8_SAPOF
MEVLKKWKKSIIKRCKSTNKEKNQATNSTNTLPKSNSYPPWCSPMTFTTTTSASPPSPRPTPGGCFSVYVGPEKQRFVMKAKYASHPLFMMLLDDAKEQYGYNSEGPIILPCGVDLFCKVLGEMDNECSDVIHPQCCAGYGSYSLFSPSRLLKLNHF